MRIAIVGGKLQGTEAVYLARKAGFISMLIDKSAGAPAAGFCDEFYCLDVREKSPALSEALGRADLLLPALENDEVLAALLELSKEHHIPLAFDPVAYGISSSKKKSDKLFLESGVPAPVLYPHCEAPCIIKPSGESGSAGVKMAHSLEEAAQFLAAADRPEEWVVQEYLTGPSYSIEVIGVPGHYRTYTVTEIHMDEVYDCKMVTAPCPLTEGQFRGFAEMGEKLAQLVGLRGIMDVEVIDHKGILKVLEIDARLPSQTPMAVYHASGTNLLSALTEVVQYGEFQTPKGEKSRYSAVEHLLIGPDGVFPHGEHIMGEGGPLFYHENYFGADEVLCDLPDSAGWWRGTFINAADTKEALDQKRDCMLRLLLENMGQGVSYRR